LLYGNDAVGGNLGLYDGTSFKTLGVTILDDLKVHHLVLTVDGTAAILYDNGNQVATATISLPTIDSCSDAKIGSNYASATTDNFIGNIYRCRFYNHALSAENVRTAFERSDVDYSSQYGSQTEKIGDAANRTFASGVGNWGAVAITAANDSGALKIPQTAAFGGGTSNLAGFAQRSFLGKDYFNTGGATENNKRYRLSFDAKAVTGGSKLYFNFQNTSDTTNTALNESVTLTTSFASYSVVLEGDFGSAPKFLLAGLDAAESFWLDNVSIVAVGCVSDYDLAFANPTQSLTVQDRSGAADGTCSASGVTQVQPVVQLNSTSARIGTTAATPADGQLLVSGNVAIGSAENGVSGAIDLSVGNPGTTTGGITLWSTTSAAHSLGFGDANSGTARYEGYVEYNHSNNSMALATAHTPRLSINSTGDVTVGQGGTASANTALTIDGTNATNKGPRLAFGRNSTNVGLIGTESGLAGNNSDDLFIFAETGHGVKIATNGAVAPKLTIDSAGDITSTNATASKPVLTLENTTADATSSQLVFNKNRSGVGVNNDILGTVRFKGNNNAGTPEVIEYATIYAQSTNVADGAEDGQMIFRTMKDGSLASRMTIDGTGLVTINNDLVLNDATGLASIKLQGGAVGADNFQIMQGISGVSNGGFSIYDVDATATRLSIDSTGNALFNTTVTNPGNGNTNTGASILSTGRMHLSTASSDHTVNRNSDGNVFEMRRSNGAVGSIAVTSSATAFNTSSDYRLKENLEPLTGALDRLDALPVYRFNFKADPDTTVDGFVAHEVSAHVPEAVTGEKDAMKTVVVQEAVEAVDAVEATYWEEGDELPEGVAVGDEKTAEVEAVEAVEEVTEQQIDPQGIDQSKLVPLLVAAVKELKAKVETLENA